MPDREFLTRGEAQIARDFENALIAQTRLTDLSPASILAMMAREAVAPELASLYDAGLAINDAFYIQRSACSGSALDRRIADFGLARQPATSAYGIVRFYRAHGTAAQATVPTGTRIAARNADGELIEFTVRGPVPAGNNPDIITAPEDDVILAAGQGQVDAVVDAVQAGSTGSVGANAIVEWVDAQPANIGAPVSGVPAAGVTNLRAFTTGEDRASDNAVRRQFEEFLNARARGTVAGLRLGATTYTQTVYRSGELHRHRPVASASVVEYLDAPGPDNLAASLYVMGQNVGQVSDTVLAALQQRIDGFVDVDGNEVEGWRSAGVKVDVRRPALLEAIITVSLTGATPIQRTTLERRLNAMVAAIPIGAPLLLSRINRELCLIGEVGNSNIVSPEDDQQSGPSEKWIPAQITVL